MSAEALLQTLRDRGVRLIPDGDSIRYCAPQGVLTDDLKAELSAHKGEVLAALQEQAALLEFAPAIEVRQQLGAVLIASPRFGQVWLALDPCMEGQLRAEESQRTDPRPVLSAADLAHLEGKSPPLVEAVLNTIAAFPGARVVQ